MRIQPVLRNILVIVPVLVALLLVAAPSGTVAGAGGTGGVGGTGAPSGDALPTEESERNPRSVEVTIRLSVEPANKKVQAHVYWGVKDLGVAPLEIRRPRGSGPLDLVVRAPGYLTYHTRLFTDRDDRLSIRLVPVTEAATVFGYRANQKTNK